MYMTVISGSERRRRWSAAEREEIVLASLTPGAVIAEVARRFDVSTSLIYRWRRDARQAADLCVSPAPAEGENSLSARAGSTFTEVVVKDESEPAPEAERMIRITLASARIDIPLSAPVDLVRAVLGALR